MIDRQTEHARGLRVEISPDHLQAWIRIDSPGARPSLAEVMAALVAAKIAVDDRVQSRAEEWVASLSEGKKPPDRFLVAEGRALVETTDYTIAWDAAIETMKDSGQDDASVDYFAISNVMTVAEGATIGRIVPSKPGQAGVDVYGTISNPKHRPMEIHLGAGVELSPKDQSIVLSNLAGKVLLQKGVLSIVNVLEIRGDVDFKTGSIDSPVDVHVSGTIRDNFHVKSDKSVVVGGCIEQANVIAAGDVIVRNGILGREKGVVTAGGQTVAKFCEGASLISTGDVCIAKEAMNSSIYTDGKLHVPRGALISGLAYAKEGVEVAMIGTPSGAAAEVIVGTHPSILARIAAGHEEIRASKKAVADAETRLVPLVSNMKRLTHEQKERLTEMMAHVESMKQGIAATEKGLEKTQASANPLGTPSVLVTKTIYAGARIRIGGYETHLERECKGPIRVELRQVKNVTQLVAVNQLTGSITPLPTSHTHAGMHEAPRAAGGHH